MRSPISCPSWVFILLVLSFISCNKNDIQPGIKSPAKENTNLVNISLTGRVMDDSGEPVGGAVVRSGTQLTQTDINGQFIFGSLMVNPQATMVEINKDGYFRTYQTIEVLPESEQYTEISLKTMSDDHQFNALNGTSYALGTSGQVNFPAEAIADKISGQNFTGTVHLSAYAMNREDSRFFQFLPAIKGLDLGKKAVVLQPFTMVNTVLTGTSGQSLEINTGKLATIRFPIADADLSRAPATISMWHYDISLGVFSEEGKAIKVGHYYEGNVSHFSVWACATGAPAITVQGNITNSSGNGLPYAKLQLFDAGGQQVISTIYRADGQGYASFQAPANQQIEIRVLNACGDVLANKKLTTGSTKLWLGKVQAAVEAGNTTTISGKVENCKNGTVYNGHITLELEGQKYRAAISDGRFTLQVARCSAIAAKASLIAIDDAGNQESGLISFEVQPGIMDLGTISTCDPRNNQFVSYNINGTNYLLQAPGDSIVQSAVVSNKTTILCYSLTDKSKAAFSFTFSGTGKPGQYPVTALSINQDKLAFVPSGNIAVDITSYGMPGEFITGKCIGQVKSPSFNQVLPFSFNFKILRQF